ncbi:MAG: 23S rRNA (uracil(1939)-C(5))-methyltransferase RlmD [Saprospiraceae bacterium]|nr:23S rRNA (uracil(1939)-C(5))-methyltransferase RlmD [Saprospiraceae bacterium]
MGRRKKKILESVLISGIADKGKAVGRAEDGLVIFTQGAVPGDVVDILVTKKRKGFLQGRVLNFKKYADHRIEPFCQHFGQCGGCKWQNLSYEKQLEYKQQVVRNAITRIGKTEPKEFLPILGSEEQRFYRNKLEFSFSCKKWLPPELLNTEISNVEDVLGFHPPRAFDKIIHIEKCYLQYEPSNKIRNTIFEIAKEQGLTFFDAVTNKGYLRNMVVRITTLNEIMLTMVVGEDDPEKLAGLLDEIEKRLPEITSLHYCINKKVNDFIMDLEIISYRGPGFVEEQLGEVKFRIGPKSFFQTNSRQAERLFETTFEFADLNGTENVYDLYCGIGSIALFGARQAKHMVGIEEIPEAIEDAKRNAKLNKIENCTFYAGDVKDILTPDFSEKHGKPDVIITDPPRAGMHPKTIDILLELNAPKIVYVSCNPATQARDIQLLSEKYTLEKLRPVDMFPQTHHIESVALLILK